MLADTKLIATSYPYLQGHCLGCIDRSWLQLQLAMYIDTLSVYGIVTYDRG